MRCEAGDFVRIRVNYADKPSEVKILEVQKARQGYFSVIIDGKMAMRPTDIIRQVLTPDTNPEYYL